MTTIHTVEDQTAVASFSDSDLFLVPTSTGVAKKATAQVVRHQMHSGIVDLTAAALTVTQALHGGKTITVNRAAGSTLTLPAATGTGTVYKIFTGTTITSVNLIIQVASASDILAGVAWMANDTDASVSGFETAGDSDTMTMNGTTKGGIKGDYIQIIDMAAGLFSVQAFLTGTGSEVTPFSAAVS